MTAEIIPLMPDEDLLSPLGRPYQEQGFDGDDETGQWLLLQASRMDGAIQQGWKMRLAQGEILTQVRDRVPGFFDRWLQAHWPQMGRTTVARLMATWEHREALSPFMDDDNFSREKNSLPVHAVDTLAMGGAVDEVVEEVLRRLNAGEHVGAKDVAKLNREAKARRSGKEVPRPPQPTETLALNLIRKGDLGRVREALNLAEQAQEVDAAAVMAELQLRQLPKGSVIRAVSADFYRLKDERWVRMPHAGQVDVEPEPVTVSAPDMPAQAKVRVVSMEQAAEVLGLALTSLKQRISPKQMQEKGPLIRNGWNATKDGRGFVRLEPAPQPL